MNKIPEDFLTIKNGHFSVDNEQIRFFGTSVGWEFLNCSDDCMERCIRYLKNNGINIVRIHPIGIWSKESQEFNKELLDRLDYLVFLLRKYNIYYCFYSFVTLFQFSPYDENFDITKARIFFDESIENNFKLFVKTLLTHENKYTEKSYIDDKYLAFVIITNENSPFKLLHVNGGKIFIEEIYSKYLKSHKRTMSGSKLNSDSLYSFLERAESSFFTDIKKYLLEIGLKVPIAFTNNPYSFYSQILQYENSDFIAVHTYGNYVGGTKRDYIKNINPLVWPNSVPYDFPTRALTVNYYNKPVIIDEWNIGYPLDFRASMPIIISLLSSFYNYDGIFYFNFFAHKEYLESPYKEGYYYWSSLEQPFSPVHIGMFPILSKIFLNCEIDKFRDTVLIHINENDRIIDKEFQYRYNPLPGKYSKLYYKKRVILQFSDEHSNLNSILSAYNEEDDCTFKTSSYYWNYNRGVLAYKSEKFFIFSGYPDYSRDNISISSEDEFITLILYALDNHSLHDSDSLFIYLVSDAEYYGDFLLPFNLKIPQKTLYYNYPSKNDFLKKKRIPALSYMKPSSILISMEKREGKYTLYVLDNKMEISGHPVNMSNWDNNQLNIRINQKNLNSIYFLLMKNN